MRLDKFMKVSRLAKRRSEAHEALEHGRITKDGKPLKPGYQVKPGDVLEIHYATRFVTVRVREVPLRVTPGVKPADLYEVLDTRKDEPRTGYDLGRHQRCARARPSGRAGTAARPCVAGSPLRLGRQQRRVRHPPQRRSRACFGRCWTTANRTRSKRAPATRLQRLPTFAIALPGPMNARCRPSRRASAIA